MDRRAFLAVTGAVTGTLAGCSAPFSGGGTADGPGGKQLYSGGETLTIQPGNFVPYRFSTTLPATLSYTLTVTDGPNVDVITTSEEEAEAYMNGDRWRFFSPASVSDTAQAQVEASIDPRSWVIIVDNTTEGQASPYPTPTRTGTPHDWVSGDRTPTPTPEGEAASVRFEYIVTSGTSPTPTANGTATDTPSDG